MSETPEPPEPEEEIQPRKRLQAYLDSCSHLGITPVTYLSKQMSNKGIVMRNHSIGPVGARALAIALLVSHSVDTIHGGADHGFRMVVPFFGR